jgi:hypothetical protein
MNEEKKRKKNVLCCNKKNVKEESIEGSIVELILKLF